jgi:hypothetical protein
LCSNQLPTALRHRGVFYKEKVNDMKYTTEEIKELLDSAEQTKKFYELLLQMHQNLLCIRMILEQKYKIIGYINNMPKE